MAKECSNTELLSRTVSLEASLKTLEKVLDERDLRYTQRAESQDNAVAAALATSKEAIGKAEQATERRLEALNELRKMAEDQGRDFVRKVEIDLIIAALGHRVGVVEAAQNTIVARGGGVKDAWGWIVAAGAIIVTGLVELLRNHP